MRITIANDSGSGLYASRRKIVARRIIMQYAMRSAEERLSKLLFEKYGAGLKIACLRVLNGCVWTNNGGEISVTIADKELDKLARLITYGNGVVAGSQILTDALR